MKLNNNELERLQYARRCVFDVASALQNLLEKMAEGQELPAGIDSDALWTFGSDLREAATILENFGNRAHAEEETTAPKATR
jgi:hypothetical protein